MSEGSESSKPVRLVSNSEYTICVSSKSLFNKHIDVNTILNKCSDRSMRVKRPAILGDYDRPTNRTTDRLTGRVIGQFHLQQVYVV